VKLLRDESGQGVLEYGLMLGLCAMVAIGALMVFGTSSSTELARASQAINAATSTGTDPSGGMRAAATRAH
jgi:Flp pilus assembly pilin Flp